MKELIKESVDPRLRLSLIDGSVEMDLSLKPLKPITLEDSRKLLPKKEIISKSKSIKIVQDNSAPDPLGR